MHEVRSIKDLLSQIQRGEILLPEFQRGYVWSRDQVRGLAQSLYRKHPTGHLLIWKTYKPSPVRGGEARKNGHSLLLLDGQQRLTSLHVLFKGKAPPFYEGETLFFDLYFNVQTEEFRFWQKTIMDKNPAWISVHELLHQGLSRMLEGLDKLDEEQREVVQQNLARLSRLDQVGDYTYTVDQVSGEEYTVEEVVNIFNRVNKAGTTLTKADLALAHICSIWPEAREEMRTFQGEMRGHGFWIDFNFMVRCLAGVATGSVMLEGAFLHTAAQDLKDGWKKMQSAFEHIVNVLRHEALVDDFGDLPTNYVLVPMTIYLAQQGGAFPTDAIKRRFIRWMFLAGIWARYSGSLETKLQQDVARVSGRDLDPTPELEGAILRERGRLRLEASDLAVGGSGTPLAKFSYVLARSQEARDWFTGIRLYDKAVGKKNGLESHHVFPKAVLRKAGYDGTVDKKVINELANRAFLTQKANRTISSTPPNKYLPEVEDNQPGALRAQGVPMDRSLWEVENYVEFLSERRRLLAKAMNEFIDSWAPADEAEPTDEAAVRQRMAAGENESLEFKSSLRWDKRDNKVNKALEKVVLKTAAGFLNSAKGGTLLIGVDDDGKPVGIQSDCESLKKKDRDGFELHLRQLIASSLGESVAPFVMVTFHEIDGHDICQVTIEASDHAVYVQEGGTATFFLRTGNATNALPINEAVKFIQSRWGKTS